MDVEVKLPKVCRVCGCTANTVEEALKVFGPRTWKGVTGVQPWCRSCRSKDSRALYIKQRAERRRAQVEAWKKGNL